MILEVIFEIFGLISSLPDKDIGTCDSYDQKNNGEIREHK